MGTDSALDVRHSPTQWLDSFNTQVLGSSPRGRTTYSGTRAVSLHVKSITSVGGMKPAFGADGASPDDRFPLAGTLRLEMRATFVAAALEAVRISLGSSLGSAARDRRR